jgi:hypothetical protein
MAQAGSLSVSAARESSSSSPAAKAKKASNGGLFAPTLAKARSLTKPPVVVKARAAKPVVSKPAVNSTDEQEVADKESGSSPGHTSHQKNSDSHGETAEAAEAAEAAAKPPVTTGAKEAALAQSAAPVEKKVKPQKVAQAKSSSQATAGQTVDSTGALRANNTDHANGIGDDESGSDGKVEIGGGFYGSGKVVERGGAGDNEEDAASTAADATDSAGDVAGDGGAVASAAAKDVHEATAGAEVAGDVAGDKAAPVEAGKVDTATVLNALNSQSGSGSASPASLVGGKTVVAATPQASFVEENHPKIVTGISGELMPKGGTMQIRLAPAELGEMQVSVHMKDGVMSASFQTSNDNATKLLTRSLGQLKGGLEAAGMSVEKLQVEQAPRQQAGQSNSDSGSDSKQGSQDQQQQAKQDQQRREMVRQMWQKLSGGGGPLDLVA